MRKQVQKERCTKIMLTKCKAVCCLYNKVQLAAAKMLDAEPAIFQFECNVPILCNDIPANDLNLPSETYTTDFVLHYAAKKAASKARARLPAGIRFIATRYFGFQF